jgi:hypothetical protein
MISKKKKGLMHQPFKVGLFGSKVPMTIDQAMGVILDPVNVKPPRKSKKRSLKK